MFRFRLERVLQHRQREVDARSRDVADTQLQMQKAEGDLAQACRQLQQCREENAANRQGLLDPVAMQRASSWQDELEARRVETEGRLASARGTLIAAQERLQEAWRDREVLERLRQRQQKEWEQEQARRERRALDEIGAIRSALAGRKRQAGSGTTSAGGD